MILKNGLKIELIKKIAAVLLFLLGTSPTIAQQDNVLWSSFQIQKSLSKNTTVNLKPIIRFNDDISSYQNTSIDVSAKQKFKKGWSMQLLNRLWFIPDQSYRHFIWLDVAHGFKLNKFKIDNRLRYHWALDINRKSVPDFLRWSTKFSFINKSKITPYFAIEPWLRMNGQNQFQRIRYEPGFIWSLNTGISINLQYRYEETFNLSSKRITNFIVFNLLFKI